MKKMRKGANKALLATAVICLCMLWGISGASADVDTPNISDAWTWDVLVVPPNDGWEGDAGVSIRNMLEWHRLDISEMGDGIHGHDIDFVLLPPLTEEAAELFTFPVTPRTIAIFSFASNWVDRVLVDRAATSGVPLLLAGGENVSFIRQGNMMPFMFALDLFRDFRCRAFVDHALMALSHESRLAIMGPRFALHEEREARITFELFMDEGFMPTPFWVDPTVSSSFSMIEHEIRHFSDGVVVSHIGGMATKEVWRGITAHRSPYRVWFGGPPDRSFLSFNGMVFADQNMYLEDHGGFEQLRRKVWSTRVLPVPDMVAAGRAHALVTWLGRAIFALPRVIGEMDQQALLASLRNVREIPFGNQILDIDSETHRPAFRYVNILEVRDRGFQVINTLNVQGVRYNDH